MADLGVSWGDAARAFENLGVALRDSFTGPMTRVSNTMKTFTYKGRQDLYRQYDPGPYLRGDQ